MNSTAQMVDNNFNKSGPDKKENKVKGLSNIYNMESKEKNTAKRPDTNFLDSNVPPIKVPILKPIKHKRMEKAHIMEIASWILEKKIKKQKITITCKDRRANKIGYGK